MGVSELGLCNLKLKMIPLHTMKFGPPAPWVFFHDICISIVFTTHAFANLLFCHLRSIYLFYIKEKSTILYLEWFSCKLWKKTHFSLAVQYIYVMKNDSTVLYERFTRGLILMCSLNQHFTIVLMVWYYFLINFITIIVGKV